jgi:hypothetical protein
LGEVDGGLVHGLPGLKVGRCQGEVHIGPGDGAPVARRGDRVEIWNPGGARAGNSARAGQNLPFILQEPWTGLVTGPARGHIASAQPPTPRPVEATHLTKQTTAPPGSRWLACSVMSCRAAFGSPAVARHARPRQPV